MTTLRRSVLCVLILLLVAPAFLVASSEFGLSTAPAPGWTQIWLLARSVSMAALSTGLSLILGLFCAWALSHRNLPGRSVLKVLLLVPFLIPSYLIGIGWLRIIDISGSLLAASLLFSLSTYPLVLFPTLLALEKLGGGLEEAAWLTMDPQQTWWRITGPLILPFSLAGASFVWMLSLVEYGVPSLLGVDTFALEIFALVQGYHDYRAAGLASLALFVCGLAPGLMVLLWGWPKMRRLTLSQTSKPSRRKLENTGGPLTALFLITSVSVVLPLASLATQIDRITVFELALWETGADLTSSLWLAGAATLLALALGAIVAFQGGMPWAGAVLLTLSIPPSLLGLGLISASNQSGTSASGLLLIWGLATRYLALPACLMALSREAIPPSQDAAAKLALSPTGYWKMTCFGFHQRAWIWAFCLTFALTIGDLTLGLLLVDPGTSTIALRIFNLHHYGRPDLVSALCLIVVGVVSTPIILATVLQREAQT